MCCSKKPFKSHVSGIPFAEVVVQEPHMLDADPNVVVVPVHESIWGWCMAVYEIICFDVLA